MVRTLIGDVKDRVNSLVSINGFVHSLRLLKKVWFIIVRDYSGLVQATYMPGVNASLDQLISTLTPESAIELTGKVVANSQVKLNSVEILLENLSIANLSEASLPIDMTSELDSRLNWRFLDIRRPENTLIFKVQTAFEHAMREFWMKEKFVEIHSPKLMRTASESGAEVFKVTYFDREAYLAQSPQFYKQMAVGAGLDRVFEIAPAFRADPSHTSRHETEFVSVDVEIGWIQSFEEVMSNEERWLQFSLQKVKDQYGDEIRKTFGIEMQVPSVPFPRIPMQKVYEILAQKGHPLPVDSDLDPEGEKIIAQHVFETVGHEFVFVTEFPVKVRPFYHRKSSDNPHVTCSFDLLWKGVEITSGAQREHHYDILLKQVQEKGLNPESMQDYLNIFRFGCPPHGGFGFGLARSMMLMLGIKNIREVVFLSRSPNRLSP